MPRSAPTWVAIQLDHDEVHRLRLEVQVELEKFSSPPSWLWEVFQLIRYLDVETPETPIKSGTFVRERVAVLLRGRPMTIDAIHADLPFYTRESVRLALADLVRLGRVTDLKHVLNGKPNGYNKVYARVGEVVALCDVCNIGEMEAVRGRGAVCKNCYEFDDCCS